MILLLLAAVFLFLYHQLFRFYSRGWQLASGLGRDLPSNSASVTILIPARNEEQHIGALLDALLEQTRKDFEVIVIDDHSTDRTASIVSSHLLPKLRYVVSSAAPELSSKKNPSKRVCVSPTRNSSLLRMRIAFLLPPG